ncbi:MAG: tetratricopeptide repeat protein, partial [Planctomycetota bacterium]
MSRVSHGPFHDAPSEDAAPPAEGREREESSARARELILKAWDAHQRGEPGVGPLATEALRHARESGSRVLEASALHTLGLAHHSTSSFEEARRFYTLASEKFRRLGRDDLRARTLGVRADVLMLQGRYRAALADARRARRIHRASGSARGSVQALNVTGNILHRLDRQEEALEVYEKAHRETLRIEGIERTRAIIDMNRANVLANLCWSRDAHRLYAKMIEWCRQQGFRSFVAQASYNEGCLLVMTGHWQEAYQRFEELGPVFAELGDRRHLALLDLDAAEVRLHLDLNDEAEEVAARAAAACEDLGLRYERARAEVIRGSALVRRGRPREALDAYRGAALDFAAEGNRTWGALTHLRIAAVRLTCGEVGAALDATVEARRMVGARGLPIVTLQARELVAQAALADGDLERASRASRAASRALRGSPTPWMEDLVWHTRGRILLAQGNKRAAMRALHRAAGQVESSRARLASDDLAIA